MNIKFLVASFVIFLALLAGTRNVDAKPSVPYNYISFYTDEGFHKRHVFYINDIYGGTWIITFRFLNGEPEDPLAFPEIWGPNRKIINNEDLLDESSFQLMNKQLRILEESISRIKIYNVNGMLLFESNGFNTTNIDLSRMQDKLLILYIENKNYFETFKIFNK